LRVGQYFQTTEKPKFDSFKHIEKNGKYYILKEVAKVSGMTDKQRDSFWNYLKKFGIEDETGYILPDNLDYKKILVQVIEFTAQEKTKQRYRHPRFLEMRYDKDFNECLFYN
jgi:ATP-dependent DNA ligase